MTVPSDAGAGLKISERTRWSCERGAGTALSSASRTTALLPTLRLCASGPTPLIHRSNMLAEDPSLHCAREHGNRESTAAHTRLSQILTATSVLQRLQCRKTSAQSRVSERT